MQTNSVFNLVGCDWNFRERVKKGRNKLPTTHLFSTLRKLRPLFKNVLIEQPPELL